MNDTPNPSPESPDAPEPTQLDPQKRYYLSLLLAAKFLKKCGPDFQPEYVVVRAGEDDMSLKAQVPTAAKKPSKPAKKSPAKKAEPSKPAKPAQGKAESDR